MKYWVLTGMACILIASSAMAQKTHTIDSLQQTLRTNLTDSQRVDTYNALASKYLRKDIALFEKYANHSIQLAKSIQYSAGLYKGYAILSTGLRIKGKREEAVNTVSALVDYVQKKQLVAIEAKAYFLLGVSYYFWNKYGLAIENLEKALEKSDAFVSTKMQGKIYNYLGEAYNHKARYFDALRCFKAGMQKWQKANFEKGVGAISSNIGGVYEALGEYPKAQEFFQKTLSIGEKLEYSSMIAMSYRNLSRVYSVQQDYSKALVFSNKALKIVLESKKERLIINCYKAVGDIYYLQEQVDKALKIFQLALKLAQKLKSQERIASIYMRLGRCYVYLKQKDRAIDYLRQAHEIYHRLGVKGKETNILLVLGKAYYKLGQPQKALEYLTPALKGAREIKSPDNVQSTAKVLADVYKALGNHQKALSHYVLYKQINDSLFSKQNTRKLAFLEAEYTFSRREDSLKLAQEKEIAQFNKHIEKRKFTQILTYIGLVVLVILFSILGLFYRSKQQSNQLLNAMNARLNSSNTALQEANEALYQQREEVLAQNQAIEEKSLIITQVNEKMSKSIQAAKMIQDAVLPFDELLKEHLYDYFILYRPRDVVSGDFYWVGKTQDTTIVVVADCTGHGVPGAFMSMIGLMLFSRIVQVYNITDPGQILENLYKDLAHALPQHEANSQIGMETSVVSLQKHSGEQFKVSFAGVGQSLLYTTPQGSCLQTFKGTRFLNLPIQKIATSSILVDPDAIFYLYSDGFMDQNDKLRKRFGSDQFRDLLYTNHHLPMDVQKQKLETALEKHMQDSSQRDDILVMGVRV
ncbi:hypothetical protein BKI52_03560 [marine bacterium AO1-C]|nr:hypothetical protein BKI52_03560 [marine bacterium AO1-C]